jgi:hypothetical protein
VPFDVQLTKLSAGAGLLATATGAATTVGFKWTVDGSPAPAAAVTTTGHSSVLRLTSADTDRTVTVTATQTPAPTDGTAADADATAVVPADAAQAEARLLWSKGFAQAAGGGCFIAALLVSVAIYCLSGDERGYASGATTGLLLVATLLGAAGVLLLLLETRGRSLTFAQFRRLLAPPPDATGGAGQLSADQTAELVKATPELLSAFGRLRAAPSVLALTALALVCATLLAHKSLPDGGAPGSTPTPTPSASTGP